MDSLTHIALGACIGELFVDRPFGKKAMVWGALMQSLPDVDFIASFWLDTSADLLAHRGFTHSILFIILITPLAALLAERIHRPHNISLKRWLLFFGVEMAIHIFLDAFNAYGTGWFEPFSHYRVTFNVLYVADPLFTIWPVLGCVWLIIRRSDHAKRVRWAGLAVSLAGIYLFIGIINKLVVSHRIKSIAQQQHIDYKRYFITPTPLNNLLWYAVLEDEKGYHIGYRSVFDTRDSISFRYFPRDEQLLEPVKDHQDLANLLRFSQGFYTVDRTGHTLRFSDLRFGQMIGWRDRSAGFVFYYYLQRPYDNNMIVQRGRFQNWDKEAFWSLLRRIGGNN